MNFSTMIYFKVPKYISLLYLNKTIQNKYIFSSSAKFYNLFYCSWLWLIWLTSNWQYNYHVCYYLYFQITPSTVSPWGNKTCPNPMVPLSLGATIILLQVKIWEIKSEFVIVWPLLSDRYVESYNRSLIITGGMNILKPRGNLFYADLVAMDINMEKCG